MPDLSEIRAGIAGALATLEGVQVSAYILANPTPPTLWVFPDEIAYHQTSGPAGHADWFFTVQVQVGLASDIGAQMRLDRMLAPQGAESVPALIEASSTLGGLVDDVTVETCSGYRQYRPQEGAGPAVLGAEWRVHVMANGS